MTAGIIAEYNIFHNGHKYMIDEVKRRCDHVVVVMSGSFVQRGDAAVTDKWTRARTALTYGADLVLELPVCYALNAARSFAEGGVNTLNALSVTDTLAFGSESGDIDALYKTALGLENEEPSVSETVRSYMSDGMSYPSALAKAHGDNAILSRPNNILAVEYIRALIRSGSKMSPFTIRRTGAEHDGSAASEKYASGARIREMISRGEDISRFIPYRTDEIDGALGYDISRLDCAAALLRTASPDALREINEVSEGLENRIIRAAAEYGSFAEICEGVKSKRYTMSRIRRVIIGALIGFTKDIYSPQPEYIRVLGMNKNGMDILREAKKKCPVPIIVKTADHRENSRMFRLDVRATDVFAITSPDPRKRIGGADFTTPPIIIN